MSKQIRKRLFWNMVGSSGLIVGGMLAFATIMLYVLRADQSGTSQIANNIVTFAAFVIVPYFLGRKFAKKNALWGLTFQRALSFMMVMYILAGFIYGLSAYLVFNYDMQYYMSMMEVSGMKMQGNEQMIEDVLNSPFKTAFGFMVSMPFLTILPALIISVLIKKEPAIRDYK